MGPGSRCAHLLAGLLSLLLSPATLVVLGFSFWRGIPRVVSWAALFPVLGQRLGWAVAKAFACLFNGDGVTPSRCSLGKEAVR